MYQNRTAYIDELNNFINSSKNSFNNVLKTINWTKQSLLSEEVESVQHSGEDKPVPDRNISPTQEGTLVEGQVYILDMHYGNPLRTISFLQHTSGGDHLYNDIVASLFVTDQRIKTDRKDVETKDKAAALIQLLKMERDAKRRRISYKNKVHTKNKSHTEVLREVLEEQMLTITGEGGNDSAVATNDRLQPSLNQAQELIAIRPSQGNPHLAWLDILEKAEDDKKRSDHQARVQKSEQSSHNRHSVDQKERCRYEQEKERKKYRKDRKRNEDNGKHRKIKEDNGKHQKRKEDNGKHRDQEKKNDWGDMDRNSSPNYEDRHHKKKKKKRSRSRSPRSDISNHHRHKSKHKKKKH